MMAQELIALRVVISPSINDGGMTVTGGSTVNDELRSESDFEAYSVV
jgi:hypothetical protein